MMSFDGFEPKEYWQSIDKFVQHMPPKEEKELCILKGHLLIEESLNSLIENQVVNPTYILRARFEFYQKLNLAQSMLQLNSDDEWVWKAIEKLNQVRNKMAHNLAYPGLDDKITDFANFVEKSLAAPSQEDQINEFGILHMSIFNVHHTINWAVSTKAPNHRL